MDIRIRIEVFALEKAMKNHDEKGKKRIVDSLESHRKSWESKDLPAIIKSDMNFHKSIIEGAKVPELLTLWQPIVASMMLHYERHHDWMESYNEHKAIADAIVSGDKKAAKKALLANLK